MIGALRLWSQRRKLRSSIPRDPLTIADPTSWLDGAGSVLHLRASCPEPSWLAHCAYWGGVKQDLLLRGAMAAGLHVQTHGYPEMLPGLELLSMRATSFPMLADMVHSLEARYPAIHAFEGHLPAQYNTSLSMALGPREPPKLDAAALSPDALIAAGYVLLLVSMLHRDKGLIESLALTCGGAASMFALGLPHERSALLELQRAAYGWPSSMTSTAFVK